MPTYVDDVRKERARATARQQKRVEIMEWYLASNFGIPPQQQCEDKKSYRGKVLWWLEPPIPNTPNPVLVEEYLGDSWTLRIEILQ